MNIWNYTFIAMGMMLIFQFAGFPTGLDPVMDYFGITFNEDNSIKTFNVSVSNFWDYIFDSNVGLLATLLGAGVAIGLLAFGKAEIAILAAVASAVLFMFIPAIAFPLYYSIEVGYPAWVTGIMAIVFIPLAGGYLIALFKYITGGSN